jgi:aspartyl-tRNA(Asn)/glutamyl-tRNA(Gln) amidotransferase subunit C
MQPQVITTDEVKHIALLSKIPIQDEEKEALATAFGKTINVIDNLKIPDTKNISPTYQVTGLTNVMRDDVAEQSLTQDEALRNAKRTHKGYFVVDQVLEK